MSMADKDAPFTLGIEEEYLLVDPESRDLISVAPSGLLDGCEKRLPGRVRPEFLQSQIEVGTSVCQTVKAAHEELVELRVPYAAIGVSDPSSRQVLRVDGDGTASAVPFDSIGISVAVAGELHQTAGYRWETWESVEWHERLKAGVELIRTAMAEPSNS